MNDHMQVAIIKNCNIEKVKLILNQLEETETIIGLICSECKFKETNNGIMVLLNISCDGYHYLASILSEMLDAIVMVLYIYNGESWNYCLCDNGEEIDQFSKSVEFFSYINEIEEVSVGNVNTIATYFNVKIENIQSYFEIYLDREYAYEDDKYKNNDTLQVIDFMRKLGFLFDFNN